MLTTAFYLLFVAWLYPLFGLQAATQPASGGPPGIITQLAPLIVAAVAVPLYQLVKKGWSWLNTQAPPWLHPILVTAVAWGLAKIAAIWGITLSTNDIGALSGSDVTGLLGAFASWIIHTIWKSTPAGSGGTSTLTGKTTTAAKAP